MSNPTTSTSNQKRSLDPHMADFYRKVLRLLNQRKISYSIAGGFALHQHTGIWRATKDLDVFLTAENMLRAVAELGDRGFECEILDPVWLTKIREGPIFMDLITGMSNAVFVVDDSWIARAKPAIVLGVRTKVLATEELLVSKLFVSRRERFDGADIAHIVYGSRVPLDWNRILDLVGEHWELLLWSLLLFRYIYPAHSGNVPRQVWKHLLKSLQDDLSKDNSKVPFRGTLVDDNMFAVDTQQWGLPNLLSEYRSRRLKAIAASKRVPKQTRQNRRERHSRPT
jgi:predicted nucleotidyltransferase